MQEIKLLWPSNKLKSLLLVEPTKSGRWKWHGALICTDHADQPSIVKEFPQLAPHSILKKWLYIDSLHDEFEPAMARVAAAMTAAVKAHIGTSQTYVSPVGASTDAGAAAGYCEAGLVAFQTHVACAAGDVAGHVDDGNAGLRGAAFFSGGDDGRRAEHPE